MERFAARTVAVVKVEPCWSVFSADNTFKMPGEKKPVIKARAGEALLLRITSRFGGGHARDGAEHSFVVKKLRDQGWDIRLK